MGFIRTKKVKGNDYAYIVSNSWMKKDKEAKQKVKEYLGRVYQLTPTKELRFENTLSQDLTEYLEKTGKQRIIKDLVIYELMKHGFSKEGEVFVNGECVVDIEKNMVCTIRNSKAALGMNEGFLCDYHLKKLLRFNESGEEEEVSYKLAKLFVESGISIPKEVFIAYFNKI
jgi:hypothetical protein